MEIVPHLFTLHLMMIPVSVLYQHVKIVMAVVLVALQLENEGGSNVR